MVYRRNASTGPPKGFGDRTKSCGFYAQKMMPVSLVAQPLLAVRLQNDAGINAHLVLVGDVARRGARLTQCWKSAGARPMETMTAAMRALGRALGVS